VIDPLEVAITALITPLPEVMVIPSTSAMVEERAPGEPIVTSVIPTTSVA